MSAAMRMRWPTASPMTRPATGSSSPASYGRSCSRSGWCGGAEEGMAVADEGRELEDAGPPPPEGFVQSTERGAFSTRNGPYFHDAAGRQAFYARKRHCNSI